LEKGLKDNGLVIVVSTCGTLIHERTIVYIPRNAGTADRDEVSILVQRIL
jgi:hypothetical protein